VIEGGSGLGETDLDVYTSSGSLHAGSLILGNSGSPSAYHGSGATVTVDGELCLGCLYGSNGTYDLEGNLQGGSVVVGASGGGLLIQTGGSAVVTGAVVVARDEMGMGEYSIASGTLDAGSLVVGDAGWGSFYHGTDQQTGDAPVVRVAGLLQIGASGQMGSTYTLARGRLEAGQVIVGSDTGGGFLAIQAGTAEVAGTIRVHAESFLDLAAGTLVADTLQVDANAEFGFFTSALGVLRVNSFSGVEPIGWAGSLHLGHAGGSGQASYTISDEQMVSVGGALIVGYDGQGTLTQTGGEVYAGVGVGVGHVAGGDGRYELSGNGSRPDQHRPGRNGLVRPGRRDALGDDDRLGPGNGRPRDLRAQERSDGRDGRAGGRIGPGRLRPERRHREHLHGDEPGLRGRGVRAV